MWYRGLLLGVAFLVVAVPAGYSAGDRTTVPELDRVVEEALRANHPAQFEGQFLPPPGGPLDFELAFMPEGTDRNSPPPPPQPMDPEQMKKWRERREQREENLQMLQTWKVMHDAHLRNDQLDKFFPLMNDMQKQERELADQRHSIARALRHELAQDNPDKAEVDKLTGQLIEASSKIWEAKRHGMEKIMGLLDPIQKAQFVLAVTSMEREMLEAVARVRMMAPDSMMGKFDREKFKQDMRQTQQQVQEQLEKIKADFKAKGYPFAIPHPADSLKH